jgi:hypothetical protein
MESNIDSKIGNYKRKHLFELLYFKLILKKKIECKQMYQQITNT